MTREEHAAAVAGALANKRQKEARFLEAAKAVRHAELMWVCAVEEWQHLVGETPPPAEPLVTGNPWCAGNPALRTEEPA